MYGKILKSLTLVKYQGICKLKVEIKFNVNLPQLLRIVVSVALYGEIERIGGFCVHLTVTTCFKKETRLESSFWTAPAKPIFSRK